MKRVVRIARRDVKGVANVCVRGHAKIAKHVKHVKHRVRKHHNAAVPKVVEEDNRDAETV